MSYYTEIENTEGILKYYGITMSVLKTVSINYYLYFTLDTSNISDGNWHFVADHLNLDYIFILRGNGQPMKHGMITI